jgi:5'-3' exonuclease
VHVTGQGDRTVWTEERIKKLKEGWKLGMTAGQIAEMLGNGVSPNMVTWLAHRLGFVNLEADSHNSNEHKIDQQIPSKEKNNSRMLSAADAASFLPDAVNINDKVSLASAESIMIAGFSHDDIATRQWHFELENDHDHSTRRIYCLGFDEFGKQNIDWQFNVEGKLSKKAQTAYKEAFQGIFFKLPAGIPAVWTMISRSIPIARAIREEGMTAKIVNGRLVLEGGSSKRAALMLKSKSLGDLRRVIGAPSNTTIETRRVTIERSFAEVISQMEAVIQNRNPQDDLENKFIKDLKKICFRLNSEQNDHFYIVDGSNIVDESYYRLPALIDPDRRPVGAVYGFTAALWKLTTEIDRAAAPTHMAVVFPSCDEDGAFSVQQYMASRRPMPSEYLRAQFPLIRDAARALGVYLLERPLTATVDMIASYVKMARAKGLDVTIVSSDPTLMQLVDRHVTLLNPLSSERIGPTEVTETFGVPPDKVGEVLALVGNRNGIPGLKGIEPKIAADLIRQYDTIEGLISNIENISNSDLKINLIASIDEIRRSRGLVRLNDDITILTPLSVIVLQKPMHESLVSFFQKHGFRSMLDKLLQSASEISGQHASLSPKAGDSENSGKILVNINTKYEINSLLEVYKTEYIDLILEQILSYVNNSVLNGSPIDDYKLSVLREISYAFRNIFHEDADEGVVFEMENDTVNPRTSRSRAAELGYRAPEVGQLRIVSEHEGEWSLDNISDDLDS